MAVGNGALGADHHHGVEQGRARELRINLIHAADDRDAMCCRRLGNRGQMTSVDVDRLLAQPGVNLAGECHVAAGPQPPHPAWISGHVGFREDDEPGAGGNGVGDVR
jgi:hypothetical protein